MQKLKAMRTLFPTALLLFFSIVFCEKTTAQTQPRSFEELHNRMLEMQRRMMEQFRNSPFNDPNFAVPQWDTTFQFRFDTTFEGGNWSQQFFHFSPFGSDSTARGGFFGFDRFFDQFFNPGRELERPDYGIGEQEFPKDDGNAQPDDGLLPEERLRKQEEESKAAKKQPAPKAAEPKPDPKIKTIRI